MIFIKKDHNSIWIPKHYKDMYPPFRLVLKHNLTDVEYTYNELEDVGMHTNYWIFYGMDFSQLDSGEHTYTLFNKYNSIVEEGLLQVMTEHKTPISYNKKQNKVIYNG
jgi:hypothetical protein